MPCCTKLRHAASHGAAPFRAIHSRKHAMPFHAMSPFRTRNSAKPKQFGVGRNTGRPHMNETPWRK
eukprot:1355033-Alexandrium_andersonii.AAC.1